ncbi:MAG: FtsX-like permease family protein [Saprospiraceae bacterium]
MDQLMLQLPLYISRRYLFSKKSTNAINIITGIATAGIAVGTAALILILCVFNGFEDLINGMLGNFNPDVTVTPSLGKTFVIDSVQLSEIRKIKGVKVVGLSLEEVAFFEYAKVQDFGIIKGVDQNFNRIVNIDSTIQEGRFKTEDQDNFYAVVGAGLRNKLAVNVENPLEPLSIFMAKSEETGALEQQFRQQVAMPIGTFSVQQEFDNQYVITSIDLVQRLLSRKDQASAYEIKLEQRDDRKTIDAIRQLVGSSFIVKDRFQQNEAFLKIMNIEKWMSFAIVSLMLILVAFNMIGSLWMIVLDKKKDISVLKAMGMKDISVGYIFLGTGFWLVSIGMLIGFVLAILIYYYHKQFGLIPVPEGFMMDTYPASIRWFDFLIVGATVVTIGIIASIPASRKAKSIAAIVNE